MKKIEELYKEWQSLQPLKPEDQTRLNQKFMLEFNFNSNHLEGNTLTYGQTKLLLMFGETQGNANLKDYEEMKAHNVGLEMMKQEAADLERPLTQSFIRLLNKTILVQDYWKDAKTVDGQPSRIHIKIGEYKSRPNSVITSTGEEFNYATPEETPSLMTSLVDWYNSEAMNGQLSPIEIASIFHYRFIRIHPFEDGNGRIARLLVNFILTRYNYPMIIIKSNDKSNYLSALRQSDVEVGFTPSDGANASLEKTQPFIKYMKDQLVHSLDISIKAAKGESIEEESDFEKQLTILKYRAKVERDGEPKDTPQNKIDLFNLFHRSFAKELIDALKPANEFFNSYTVHYFMTKGVENINGQSNVFFRLDVNSEMPLDLLDYKEMDILTEARSIMFTIAFQGVKVGFRMKDISIHHKASIIFEDTYYSFNNKTYEYGTFPTDDEAKAIINNIKNDVLQKIQNAIIDK